MFCRTSLGSSCHVQTVLNSFKSCVSLIYNRKYIYTECSINSKTMLTAQQLMNKHKFKRDIIEIMAVMKYHFNQIEISCSVFVSRCSIVCLIFTFLYL